MEASHGPLKTDYVFVLRRFIVVFVEYYVCVITAMSTNLYKQFCDKRHDLYCQFKLHLCLKSTQL